MEVTKALSIKPPWAYLVVYGYPLLQSVSNGDGSTRFEFSGKVLIKRIENRSNPTKYRGRLFIHVSKQYDKSLEFGWGQQYGISYMGELMMHSTRLIRGAIIGEVQVVDCVTGSESPWFTGPYGWVLSDPKAYDEPIPCKGRLGLWTPPQDVLERIA